MYYDHLGCRACGFGTQETASGIKSATPSDHLVPVFDLGLQPLANDFCAPGQEHAGYAPLKVLYCPRCSLAQLSVTVRPDILYSRYSYVTSTSETMMKHFAALADLLIEQKAGPRLLEIGSNDGRMLQYFQSLNMDVCGIDPAANLAEIANKAGVRTVCGLLNEESANEAADRPFDVVIARHVFCHVDDWRDFLRHVWLTTHNESLVCLEVPYCKDMLDRGEFDTIYHEHTSYLTLKAITALLANSPFRLHRVVRFPIHGGAILLMMRSKSSRVSPDPGLAAMLAEEHITLAEWQAFDAKARQAMLAMKETVRAAREQGKRVCGFGASAKSTVWVNACGFTRKDVQFITDTTRYKQWKLSPGTDIPIVDEGALLRELPDIALCFAWNFAAEILEKNALARSKGVKFYVPIPDPKLL